MSHPASHDATVAPDDELSMLDLLVILARQKKVIVRTAAAFALLGMIYVLLVPSQYTSSAIMVPETVEENSGGALGGALSALRSFGLAGGGMSMGITAQTFPDIMTGRSVLLAVVRDTLPVPELGRTTLTRYFNQPPGVIGTLLEYTLGLPRKIKDRLTTQETTDPFWTSQPDFPTFEEKIAIDALTQRLSISVNEDSGIMTASIKTQDPNLSALILQRLLHHFSERIREIHTKRARDIYTFISARFAEAEAALQEAEALEASFLDRNRILSTALLEAERDRLRRQVSFKEQLYSDLQTQLTQAELELQQSESILTILENPVPPLLPSEPRRAVLLVMFVILGGVLGVTLALVNQYLRNQMQHSSERTKIQEVRDALRLSRLRRRSK